MDFAHPRKAYLLEYLPTYSRTLHVRCTHRSTLNTSGTSSINQSGRENPGATGGPASFFVVRALDGGQGRGSCDVAF